MVIRGGTMADLEEVASQNESKTSISPPYYKLGDVECVDAIKSACEGLNGFEGYCTGNAIKYLWRWKHKNGVEDLKKADWYIRKLANGIKND